MDNHGETSLKTYGLYPVVFSRKRSGGEHDFTVGQCSLLRGHVLQ